MPTMTLLKMQFSTHRICFEEGCVVGSGDIHRRMYVTLAGAGGLTLGNMTSNVGHLKVSAIRPQSHGGVF